MAYLRASCIRYIYWLPFHILPSLWDMESRSKLWQCRSETIVLHPEMTVFNIEKWWSLGINIGALVWVFKSAFSILPLHSNSLSSTMIPRCCLNLSTLPSLFIDFCTSTIRYFSAATISCYSKFPDFHWRLWTLAVILCLNLWIQAVILGNLWRELNLSTLMNDSSLNTTFTLATFLASEFTTSKCSNKILLGQHFSPSLSQAGPFHHNSLWSNVMGDVPCEPKSAGFSVPGQCPHWFFSETDKISLMLWHTNCFQSHLLLIQNSTVLLSDQYRISSILTCELMAFSTIFI